MIGDPDPQARKFHRYPGVDSQNKPGGISSDMTRLMYARTLDKALALACRTSIRPQTFIIGIRA